jgi:2-hydroxychromene-2-carboxylate isomerase
MHRRPAMHRATLAKLDVDADPVIAAAHTDGIKQKIRAETAEAQLLSIFWALSFTTPDGELFWGNDQLERALA